MGKITVSSVTIHVEDEVVRVFRNAVTKRVVKADRPFLLMTESREHGWIETLVSRGVEITTQTDAHLSDFTADREVSSDFLLKPLEETDRFVISEDLGALAKV